MRHSLLHSVTDLDQLLLVPSVCSVSNLRLDAQGLDLGKLFARRLLGAAALPLRRAVTDSLERAEFGEPINRLAFDLHTLKDVDAGHHLFLYVDSFGFVRNPSRLLHDG